MSFPIRSVSEMWEEGKSSHGTERGWGGGGGGGRCCRGVRVTDWKIRKTVRALYHLRVGKFPEIFFGTRVPFKALLHSQLKRNSTN